MDKNSLDCVAQDVHSILCLTTSATQDILCRINLVEGVANTPDAIYGIDDSDLSALWGALEAMRFTRDKLGEVLQTI